MENYKMIFIPIIILAIVIGVGGCMKSGKPAKEEMMEFMKNKYNEEFEFVSIGNEAWNANYTEMIVHSEKFPEGRIVVRKSGDIITDNYTDFLMKEKIEKELSAIVAQVYPESKVLYMPGGMPTSDKWVNPDMSVQEYSKGRLISLPTMICIKDDNYRLNKEQKIEELRNLLENKQIRCSLNVFYVLDGKLDLINDENANELFSRSTSKYWAEMRGDFIMDDSFKFKYYEWREKK